MNPLIIAHRGASTYAPENTIAAFEVAFALGADGIELDVALTQDGVPVVIHDDTVDRTTDGNGTVAQMTLGEVQSLDAGSWYNAQFRGERIPTLVDVLQKFGRRGVINIELKGSRLQGDGLEIAVIQAVESARLRESVILSSFNPIRLLRMARISRQIERGLLYSDTFPIYLRRAWLRPIVHPTALHPNFRMVTSRYVRWARDMGYGINTWTVDDPTEMKRLVGLGVNAIITKRIDLLKQLTTVA